MTRVYYKEAVGAFIVFDATRSETFQAVDKWKADLDTKVLMPDGRPIPCILIGNKCDQPASESKFESEEAMNRIAHEKGFTGKYLF